MSVSSEILRIQSAKADIISAIEEKGGTVSGRIDTFGDAIRELPSGGGDINSLIDRTITSVSANATVVGSYAFYSHPSLTTAFFPACTTIGASAFYSCKNLEDVSFPACTTIGASAFAYCSSLTTVSFPACTNIGISAFGACGNLTTVSFPACTTIGASAFAACGNLSSIYLGRSSVVNLVNSAAFSFTKITTSTGSIFVPASLLSTYKSASFWSYFKNCIYSYDF